MPENPSKLGFYKRNHRLILLLILLASPLYLWIAAKVLTPGDMSAYLLDVSHWLPQDSQLIADMEKFSEVAGKERGNVIRISWPGCSENDERMYEFAELLRTQTWNGLGGVEGNSPVFHDVMTIDDFIEKVKSQNRRLSDVQIYRQMQNVLIGRDGTTCVIATLATREPEKRSFAIKKVYSVANDIEGLSADQVKMFGGPVYTAQIDKMGLEIVQKFTPISVAISVLCAWVCLRNTMLMLAVFLNAIISTSLALVSMYITDAVMDPLLMLIPGFWFIMSISAGLHFVNYYHEEQGKGTSEIDSVTAAASVAWRPTFLAVLTTCIGLGSLCTSEIMPVWRFGFHSAIGLACSFLGLFLFLPSFLSLFADKVDRTDVNERSLGTRFWSWYESFVMRFGAKTTLLFLLLLLLGAIGFSNLGFSNKLRDQFATRTKINSDTNWFEDHIGPVIPIELLVRFPKDELPGPSDCLEYIDSLQKRVGSLSAPTKTLSATAVVPFESGSGARQAIFRKILDKKIEKQREALSKTGYVIDEPDHELWRVTVFVFNGVETTLSSYYEQIQFAVAEQNQSYKDRGISASVSYSGLGSRMAVITGKLGGGLMRSIFVSAILISMIVILALRSFWLGMVAMIPNIFPIVMSFGTYGYFQPSLDIGSIMTASIAMGIAVDDTIHFMYWFRKGITGNLSRVDAIKLAIRKCGRAITATSLICGLGFFVYFFCDFMPVARFGQLLFVMLAAALVGDLFFLPALLNSLPVSYFKRSGPESKLAKESV